MTMGVGAKVGPEYAQVAVGSGISGSMISQPASRITNDNKIMLFFPTMVMGTIRLPISQVMRRLIEYPFIQAAHDSGLNLA